VKKYGGREGEVGENRPISKRITGKGHSKGEKITVTDSKNSKLVPWNKP